MTEIKIGKFIEAKDSNEAYVTGTIEKILQNTVIIVDKEFNRFLVRKTVLEQQKNF
ncbi:hypothetical protein [Enterococcus saccharolyticus]|uniref:DUF2187 domain-containing protein n=1 Tax=Enterococcus saccharolyticus subsp. saccharolyticus ATCC 43076 TaxID=1139996 RepID=S0JMY2_9ENTE|nr:hypothetical protein [Enterococcus saccharolyticus]EOT29233.1 hypothetical protein OMQ_01185 [Enterococcus saccharolyticus subsp. saccharolyticus ATCC 43076]EOT81032.1 hypothetical protein I572_01564 [Enterococcus saccharolyticus subsp. saccharolyticus ATCC 43076]OJG86840.1 hypothetical protein RV16_GL000884 [Enterococcus saccharolyticus]